MSLNLVTVSGTFQGSAADTVPNPEGTYRFVPTGMQYDSAQHVMIVPQVIQGNLNLGVVSVVLVASDNFLAGVLTWDVLINVRGMFVINQLGCIVNFANGAAQNLFTILAAAGWSPPNLP